MSHPVMAVDLDLSTPNSRRSSVTRPSSPSCKTRSASRERIQECVVRLSEEADGIFARNVSEFIVCTEEAAESDPAVVMRNERQFVSGIKNYLVRNGERGRLTEVIDEERERVSAVADSLLYIQHQVNTIPWFASYGYDKSR